MITMICHLRRSRLFEPLPQRALFTETAEAMVYDGLKRETVKIFIHDKELFL